MCCSLPVLVVSVSRGVVSERGVVPVALVSVVQSVVGLVLRA